MSTSFEVRIFDGHEVRVDDRPYYLATYNLFEATWREAMKEVPFYKESFADEFTRQNVVISLLSHGECLGFICLREVDCSSPLILKDSAFLNWEPRDFKAILNSNYSKGIICSYLTVKKDFRHMTHLLSSIACLLFHSSGRDVMFGNFQSNYSLRTYSDLLGSIQIGEVPEHPYLKPQVGLNYFTRSSVERAFCNFPKDAFRLFNNRKSTTMLDAASVKYVA